MCVCLHTLSIAGLDEIEWLYKASIIASFILDSLVLRPLEGQRRQDSSNLHVRVDQNRSPWTFSTSIDFAAMNKMTDGSEFHCNKISVIKGGLTKPLDFDLFDLRKSRVGCF